MAEWDDMLERGEYAPIDWKARAEQAEADLGRAYAVLAHENQLRVNAEAALSRARAAAERAARKGYDLDPHEVLDLLGDLREPTEHRGRVSPSGSRPASATGAQSARSLRG